MQDIFASLERGADGAGVISKSKLDEILSALGFDADVKVLFQEYEARYPEKKVSDGVHLWDFVSFLFENTPHHDEEHHEEGNPSLELVEEDIPDGKGKEQKGLVKAISVRQFVEPGTNMKRVYCNAFPDFIKMLELQHDGDQYIHEFALCRDKNGNSRSATEAKELAQALSKCPRASDTHIKIEGHDFGAAWRTVLEELAENKNFVGWNLYNVGLDCEGDDLGLFLAECLQRAPWVVSVILTGNKLNSFPLTNIVRSALRRPKLSNFRIQCAEVVDNDLLTACSDLKRKFPQCRLGGGGYHGMLFEALVAMRCIRNPESELKVRDGQRQMLLLVSQGDMVQAQDTLQKLRDEVIKPEHDRLLQLLSELLIHYCVVGGLGAMATLPAQKDEYAGEGAEGQFCPESLKHEPKEHRIRHLLAMAPYKQPYLKDLLYGVQSDIYALEPDRVDSQSDIQALTIPSLVQSVLARHGLDELTARMPAYKVVAGEEDAKHIHLNVSGVYEFHGHIEGEPCCPVFKKEDGRYKLFLYRRDGRWRIGPRLGSWGATLLGSKNESNSKPLSEGWTATRSKRIVALQLTPCTSELLVQNELVDFLRRRAQDEAFRQLLTFSDELAHVVIGPPKSYARALQKGPDWLLDLNRGTIVFDSPILLVIGFHLLQARVENLGGSITRLSNYFLPADPECLVGTINSSYTQPPCIHLTIKIDGWSFEVMLMLSDFYVAKKTLHRYYELMRAPDVMSALMPVFEPTGDVNTPCEVRVSEANQCLDSNPAAGVTPRAEANESLSRLSQTGRSLWHGR